MHSSGKLSLLPSVEQEMRSSLGLLTVGYTGLRHSVADWGDGVSISCTAGIVR